jgi:hypothetical protein
MANSLVKKDLLDAILELRADVEKKLQANKYYVALGKLDELLAAIKPLEMAEARPASPEREMEAAVKSEPQPEPVRTWSGLVQETVIEGEAARPA